MFTRARVWSVHNTYDTATRPNTFDLDSLMIFQGASNVDESWYAHLHPSQLLCESVASLSSHYLSFIVDVFYSWQNCLPVMAELSSYHGRTVFLSWQNCLPVMAELSSCHGRTVFYLFRSFPNPKIQI